MYFKKIAEYVFMVLACVTFSLIFFLALNSFSVNYGDRLFFSGLILPVCLMAVKFKRLSPLLLACIFSTISCLFILYTSFVLGIDRLAGCLKLF
jgi:hypothetical protein